MPFTKEELAEMAAADAEIERTFRITRSERAASNRRDSFGRKEKIAAAQREYREDNAYMRWYMRKLRATKKI